MESREQQISVPQQETSGSQNNLNRVVEDITICGILVYEVSKVREKNRFRRDCENLQHALRFCAKDANLLTIVDKDNVQVAFLEHMLQWEDEIFRAPPPVDQVDVDAFQPDRIYRIVQHIYWFFKRTNALSNILKNSAALISPNHLLQSQIDKERQYINCILGCVEERWRRVCVSAEIGVEKAKFLSALTSLWKPSIDYFADGSKNSKVLHKIIGELQLSERLAISESFPFNETTKRDADRFFEEWIYSRGIPISGEKALYKLLPSLKDDLRRVFGDLPDKLVKDCLSKLRRLCNRTFWFHYSGHHSSDGIQDHDLTIPSLRNVLQAAGYVLSNIVATLDCCFADSLINNVLFTVDPATNYSGLTIISSCSSVYEAQVKSCFTPLLVNALSGASFTCLRPHRDPCRDNCFQKLAQCSTCTVFSAKCKKTGRISISNIFHFIKDHMSQDRMLTVRRHYAKCQLPVARFVSRSFCYRIICDVHGACDQCKILQLNISNSSTYSMTKVRKRAFLHLLQHSLTKCMGHCKALQDAHFIACRLYIHLFSPLDKDEHQHLPAEPCNYAAIIGEMLEYSPLTSQGNFSVRDFKPNEFKLKRISMLRFSMKLVKNSSTMEVIQNQDDLIQSLPDGIRLEMNTKDTLW